MQMRNTLQSYGLVARLLHWIMALAIFSMFALGLWMRSLTYYSPWYHRAPELHKSIGILLLTTLVLRFLWRVINTRPEDGHLSKFEQKTSNLVHWGFYLLLLALMSAGYLISTVDGHPIKVFGLVEIPSLYQQKGLEDTVALIHEILAYSVITLAVLHAGAALKHHFLDHDVTLRRMLSSSSRNQL